MLQTKMIPCANDVTGARLPHTVQGRLRCNGCCWQNFRFQAYVIGVLWLSPRQCRSWRKCWQRIDPRDSAVLDGFESLTVLTVLKVERGIIDPLAVPFDVWYSAGQNVYLPVFCFEGLISEFPKFTYRIPSPRASFSSQVKKNRKPD